MMIQLLSNEATLICLENIKNNLVVDLDVNSLE